MIRNVVEYLQATAQRVPNKIALVDGDRELSFKELEQEAQKVASIIIERCGDIRNQPIAVYMDKSADCVTTFVGIAYSGNFYSPLDVKSPMERINRIVDTLNPVAIISKTDLPSEIKHNGVNILWNDIIDETIDERVTSRYQITLDIDPLYVLFTSGSTGQPKGVVISHKSVIDYTEWLHNQFPFDQDTVFGEQAPFYFDNSILDIYSTLKNGATLVIIPEKLFMFPQLLLEYMNERAVNTLFWVPSALIGVANSGVLDKVMLPNLRAVLFCGEVMPNKQLNVWRRHYPDILYANLYGPTEITDVCSFYVVNRAFEDDEALPIGYACENTEILILNEENEVVKEDEVGELCVRGTCLSMGYYGDWEKTNHAFVQNPLNPYYRDLIYRTGDLVKYNEYGEIIYICRKDFQIKYQGHRIELGEIEAMSNALEGVTQSCVIYDDINKKIILFCTVSQELSEKQIYKALKMKLPRYMLPALIVIENEIRLNANGKINRAYYQNKVKEM